MISLYSLHLMDAHKIEAILSALSPAITLNWIAPRMISTKYCWIKALFHWLTLEMLDKVSLLQTMITQNILDAAMSFSVGCLNALNKLSNNVWMPLFFSLLLWIALKSRSYHFSPRQTIFWIPPEVQQGIITVSLCITYNHSIKYFKKKVISSKAGSKWDNLSIEIVFFFICCDIFFWLFNCFSERENVLNNEK